MGKHILTPLVSTDTQSLSFPRPSIPVSIPLTRASTTPCVAGAVVQHTERFPLIFSFPSLTWWSSLSTAPGLTDCLSSFCSPWGGFPAGTALGS